MTDPEDGTFEAGLWALEQIAKPGESFTLREIGHACGVSYEWIRQIEERALIKLRRELIRQGVEPEDVAFVEHELATRKQPTLPKD